MVGEVEEDGLIVLGRFTGTYTGFTVRWQKLQVMPLSKSFGNRSEPSVAFSTRPSIHAGAWHWKQVSPAPATSCSAMETAARKMGARRWRAASLASDPEGAGGVDGSMAGDAVGETEDLVVERSWRGAFAPESSWVVGRAGR